MLKSKGLGIAEPGKSAEEDLKIRDSHLEQEADFQRSQNDGQRRLSHRRHSSWPPSGSSSTAAGQAGMTKCTFLPVNSLVPQAADHSKPKGDVQHSIPIVLCKKCRRKRPDWAAVEAVASLNATENSAKENGRFEAGFRFINWPCRVCGNLVKLPVQDPDFGAPARLQPGAGRAKPRSKLKSKMSKVHKTLLTTLGMTPELPALEELETGDRRHEESRSSVTNGSGSAPHGLTTNHDADNRSEPEHCEGKENTDVDGRCVTVEKQPSVDDVDFSGRKTKTSTSESTIGGSAINPNLSTASLSSSAADEGRSGEPSCSSKSPSTLPETTCSNGNPATATASTNASNSNHHHQGASRQPSATSTPVRSVSESSRDQSSPSPAPTAQITNDASMGAAMYKPDTGALYLPLVSQDSAATNGQSKKSPSAGSLAKQGSRKKKRSGSWYNVLSPSYKQKNEDLHKFFKNLPETERLLVDHTCALVKDILIQGRLYVSQNYICFHSRFLKLQTAIQVPFKEITSLTKEKTVKVIPNAIQIQSVTRGKLTFTSFTARDRAYQQVQKLWHNALQDKPMTPQELWSNIRDQYGNYLGCSSDDDYVKPEKSLNYSLDGDSVEVKRDSFEYSDGAKQKKKKNALQRSTRIPNGDVAKPLILNGRTPSERERLASITDHSTGDDKSSYPGSVDDRDMFEDDDSLPTENGQIPAMECEDSGPCEFAVPCFKRVYLEKTFSVPVDHLFDTIYGQNCPFWKNHLSKEANDITITNWQAGSGAQQEGHQVRVLEYLLLLSNPLGPKSSRVTETQVWYKESEAGQSYGVDCIAQMHGVPYGDYFTTVMRYSMRKVTKSTSELRVSADIRFNKTPWGLVKNFIEKNAYSGIDDNFTKLGPELEEYFEAQKQHRSRQPSLSEPSLRTFPRQRLSVSASGERKRNSSTNEDPNDQTTAKHIPNGEVRSATSGEGVIAAPTVTPLALPSRDYNNNSSSHHVTKPVGEESFGRRWRNRALVFVLALLLFSNYSMYQRLSTLEEIQSSKVAVDLSNLPPNQQPNSVFEVTDPSDLTSSDRIKLLERRLSRLESVVTDHVSASGERWRHLEENWRAMDRKIDAILSKLDRDTKT